MELSVGPTTQELRVIRFKGAGASEYHELALTVSTLGSTKVRVIYKDRVVECDKSELEKAIHVNVNTLMNKAQAFHTVVRDLPSLRESVTDPNVSGSLRAHTSANEVESRTHVH